MDKLTRADLLPADLPDGRELIADGRDLAAQVSVGRSLLCEEQGVRNELEYKRKMRDEGRVMTTMNIGLQDWPETARAIEKIHAECERRGFRIDRYQMQLDRRMGIPPEFRSAVAKETGPLLESQEQWMETTRTAPIQPGLGDMMIGSPQSVENAMSALRAGVTYIGNLSQFPWKFPGWYGTDVDQMSQAVRAMGLMAAKRDDGATLQSYLDDGFPAQFNDFTSYIGWAMFERRLVEDVVGSQLAISYGGLTHNPFMKTAMSLALEAITPEGMCNPFYHCNTTVYGPELDLNYGVLSVDMLYLLMVQQRYRTGAAVLAVPVTEAVRIPTWNEVVEVHAITRRVADFVPMVVDFADWERAEALKDELLAGGRTFYENLCNGLSDMGIDIDDPLQVVLAVRRLGAVQIERLFGAGQMPEGDVQQLTREPLIPTDTLQEFLRKRDDITARLHARGARSNRAERRLVLASTDVHEFGMLLVFEALKALDLEPVVAGTGVNPDELSDLALEVDATAILVSTHNGMALRYAEQLLEELAARGVSAPVVFGGILNQDVEGRDAPVEVHEELEEIGIKVCMDPVDLVDVLGLESTVA